MANVDGPLLKECRSGPLAGVNEIVFVTQGDRPSHYYDAVMESGGQMLALDVTNGKIRVLCDSDGGAVRDPCVSYDGKRILFSWAQGGEPRDLHHGGYRSGTLFHIHEMNADGRGEPKRLLPEADYHDVEPTYLPDGGIAFMSTRARRSVGCVDFILTFLLHRMDRQRDGSWRARPLSNNAFPENTLSVMRDGRICFVRWEYVNRRNNAYHTPWTINPDGTASHILLGNMHMLADRAIMSARSIPGSERMVATFGSHMSRGYRGRIGTFDPNFGPDDESSVEEVLWDDAVYWDPWPLCDEWFLVGTTGRLLLARGDGKTETLYEDRDGLNVHSPSPIAPRPREPVLSHRIRLADKQGAPVTTGKFLLADVYDGRNMGGVPRGSIKSLLVMEQPPMPVGPGPQQGRMSMDGPWSYKRVLGTVPVEPDGSAYFEVPAMRNVFFTALDEKDMAVKTMWSATYVAPGERIGCTGCHEPRTQAPATKTGLMALSRPASTIEPIPGVPASIDFVEHIQPILDTHCLKCHGADNAAAGVYLDGASGDGYEKYPKPSKYMHLKDYTRAFITLTAGGDVVYPRNSHGNFPPYSMGSSASRLMTRTDGSHPTCKATLTPLERKLLSVWIDMGATNKGSYARHYKSSRKQLGLYGVELISDTSGELDCYATDEAYFDAMWKANLPADYDLPQSEREAIEVVRPQWDARADATYHSPFDLAFSLDGKTLLVSDRTAGAATLIDVTSKEIAATIPLHREPTGVCWAYRSRSRQTLAGSEESQTLANSATTRAYVAEYGSGTVAEIDVEAGKVARRFQVGRYPVGVAAVPGKQFLVAANHGIGSASIIDLASGERKAEITDLWQPYFVAVTPDETTAVIGSRVPRFDCTSDRAAAEVSLIDLGSFAVRSKIRLPLGSSNVHGIAVSPDGQTAYVVHTLGRFHLTTTHLDGGWVVTNQLSVIDLAVGKLIASVPLDKWLRGAANPWGAALAPGGSSLWITMSGTHELGKLDVAGLDEFVTGDEVRNRTQTLVMHGWERKKFPDPVPLFNVPASFEQDGSVHWEAPYRPEDDLRALHVRGLFTRRPLEGNGPRGVAVSPDGSKVATAMYFTGNVVLASTLDGRTFADIPLGKQPPDSPRRSGERHFHDAAHCFQNWLSCATCHPDARADGLNWDLQNDGVGNAKNTKSMLLAHATPPVMAKGVRSRMADAVAAGFRDMQFIVPEPKTESDVNTYLASLTPLPSPYLTASDELTESARRGKALFDSTEVGCVACHSGPYLTDGKQHDVGTRGPLDNEDRSQDLEFDTPTLIEAWGTAPYLHDGRATTVLDVLTVYNQGDRHGRTSQLSEQQLRDLARYVLSL